MRTNVTFRHPAEFVPLSDEDGVLAVSGALWFVTLLQDVAGLQIDDDSCQEDWGVVIFARRNGRRFWIGLSAWDAANTWLAQFHHGPFAWLQRFGSSGKGEFRRLLCNVHAVLNEDPAVSDVAWYAESEMSKAEPAGFRTPVED
jgi:hypothetical protein